MAAVGRDLRVQFAASRCDGAAREPFGPVDGEREMEQRHARLQARKRIMLGDERALQAAAMARETAQERFVEGGVGAIEQIGRGCDERDQAARDKPRVLRDRRPCPHRDEAGQDGARMVARARRIERRQMTQPEEAVERARPGRRRIDDGERRSFGQRDHLAAKRVVARHHILGDGGIERAQFRRHDHEPRRARPETGRDGAPGRRQRGADAANRSADSQAGRRPAGHSERFRHGGDAS